MTILEALQEWFEELLDSKFADAVYIFSDVVPNNDLGFALASAGGGNQSQDISGKRVYQYSYILYAKSMGKNEVDRRENQQLLENIIQQVEERVDAGDLPALPDNKKATDVIASNPLLFDLLPDGSAIYQIQIQLKFEKRRQLWQ